MRRMIKPPSGNLKHHPSILLGSRQQANSMNYGDWTQKNYGKAAGRFNSR